MNTEKVRRALHEVAAESAGGLDNFAVRGLSLAQADVTRFELETGFAAQVAADVLKASGSLADKQFLPYDPSYQTNSSQVLVEELSQIPELDAIDRIIRNGDLPLDSGGGQAVAMAHVVSTGVGKIVAYRLKGPGIFTRRARGIPLVPRDGVYRVLTAEILYYEPRFDAYTFDGNAFFATVTIIQTKLHADSKARQLARETLKSVTAQVRIDGYKELEAAVMDDPTLRSKMAAVARIIETDPDYARHLTTKKLVGFIEAYPAYQIPISKLQGQKVLRFDPSPQHRHQIPRLLADDYLHSYLTERSYEAGSKHQV